MNNCTENSYRTKKVYKHLSSALALISLLTVCLTFGNYGLAFDELTKAEYGKLIRAWYSSGFKERGALDYYNLYYYGGLFDLPASVFRLYTESFLGDYESLHLFTALVGLSSVFAVWKIGFFLGSYRTAFFAALFLMLTPRYYGEIFNNIKDVPFAAACTWSLYYILRFGKEFPEPSKKTSMKLGLAIGCAMGVRIGGLVLWGYLALLLLCLSAYHFRHLFKGLVWLRLTLKLLLSAALSYLVMLSCWPWAQIDPINRPLEALEKMKNFDWVGGLLFEGQHIGPKDIPWYYSLRWIEISTPSLFLILFALGIVQALWFLLRRGNLSHSATPLFLVFTTCFPIVYVIYQKSVLYDGLRHLLFVLPPLVAVAAFAFTSLLDALELRVLRGSILALVCAFLLLTASDMKRLHPYEYIYFNRLFAGGLSKVYGQYETEYWGLSFKEGVEWLAKENKDKATVTVSSASHPYSTAYYVDQHSELSYTHKHETSDYYLATTRTLDHLRFNWPVVHIVWRDGVPILFARKKVKW